MTVTLTNADINDSSSIVILECAKLPKSIPKTTQKTFQKSLDFCMDFSLQNPLKISPKTFPNSIQTYTKYQSKIRPNLCWIFHCF